MIKPSVASFVSKSAKAALPALEPVIAGFEFPIDVVPKKPMPIFPPFADTSNAFADDPLFRTLNASNPSSVPLVTSNDTPAISA